MRILILRQYELVRNYSVVAWPIWAVAILTIGSLVAVRLGIIPWPYVSTYVAAVAIVSNRVCVRAGVMTAVLSAPVYNFLFTGGPHVGFTSPDPGEITAYIAMIVVALVIAPRTQSSSDGSRRQNDAGTDLPFTRRDRGNGQSDSLHGSGVCFWDVQPSGVWTADCEVGAEYARIFMERVKAGEPRPLLSWIAYDMVRRGPGNFSGVEAGFMQGICHLSLPSSRAV